MNHSEFVAAYSRGDIRVEIDRKAAGRFLAARLLLPFVTMPVLGIGVALALVGWIYTGLIIIAAGIVLPRMIKHGAPRFLLQRAIEDAPTYDALLRSHVMRLAPPAPDPGTVPGAHS